MTKEIKIEKKDGKFYINIPFSLKDSLKEAIPSAKFDGKTKQWFVGPRSGEKLEKWLAENQQDIKDAHERKIAFENELLSRKPLSGYTYACKDELKERFGAIYGGISHVNGGMKSWFVKPEFYEEAQAFVDAFTEQRKKEGKFISRADVKKGLFADDVVTHIKRTLKNFKKHEGSYIYSSDDEFYEFLSNSFSFDDYRAKRTLEKLMHDIEAHLHYATENDNPPFVFNIDLDLLNFFGLMSVNVFAMKQERNQLMTGIVVNFDIIKATREAKARKMLKEVGEAKAVEWLNKSSMTEAKKLTGLESLSPENCHGEKNIIALANGWIKLYNFVNDDNVFREIGTT